jgi:hypothetical protein
MNVLLGERLFEVRDECPEPILRRLLQLEESLGRMKPKRLQDLADEAYIDLVRAVFLDPPAAFADILRDPDFDLRPLADLANHYIAQQLPGAPITTRPLGPAHSPEET